MRSSSPHRYPSDLTDEQWALIEAMVQVRSGGRPAVHPRRRIVEAILYVNRTGCSWRQLPHDFPPWATVYWYFKRWNRDLTTDRIHDALRDAVRDAAGRDPMASAGIVDAQSVKGADTVGPPQRTQHHQVKTPPVTCTTPVAADSVHPSASELHKREEAASATVGRPAEKIG